jgi:hypothetical protein
MSRPQRRKTPPRMVVDADRDRKTNHWNTVSASTSND